MEIARRTQLEAVAELLAAFMDDADLDAQTPYTYGEVLDRLGLALGIDR